jgi:hypothetical protein
MQIYMEATLTYLQRNQPERFNELMSKIGASGKFVNLNGLKYLKIDDTVIYQRILNR